MQKKVAGVLGGMGPDATIDFMAKVITRTEAKADQDHIRMIVDHNPKVPNRTEAIKGTGENAGVYLAEMAKRLERADADFLVLVCNTAHAFKADVQKAVSIPFVSIIDEVTSTLKRTYPQNSKIGIMASQGCLETKLYQNALSEAGFQYVVWSDAEVAEFMTLLYNIKGGDRSNQVKQGALSLTNRLIKKGAEVILAGCTEIPLVIHEDSIPVPLVASTDILVDRVIDYSLGHNTIST